MIYSKRRNWIFDEMRFCLKKSRYSWFKYFSCSSRRNYIMTLFLRATFCGRQIRPQIAVTSDLSEIVLSRGQDNMLDEIF